MNGYIEQVQDNKHLLFSLAFSKNVFQLRSHNGSKLEERVKRRPGVREGEVIDAALVRSLCSEQCYTPAVCAAVIGACYLASFCAAKRVLARATVVASRTFSPSGMAMTSESPEMDQVISLSKGTLLCFTGQDPVNRESSVASSIVIFADKKLYA